MAWSGKIANRGWKAGFWRARKILEALARDGGQKLAAWFRKADEDQSAALKLGRKAASGALGVLALTGKTCWALALAGDKAWALARGGISWDEHFELLREAEGIPLSRLAVMEHSQEQQDEAFWWACRRSLKCMEILSPSSVNIEIAGESGLDRALGVLGAVGSQLDDEAEGRISWLLERGARARSSGASRGARSKGGVDFCCCAKG